MGNMCTWRQGKSKLADDNLSIKNENDIIHDFRLKGTDKFNDEVKNINITDTREDGKEDENKTEEKNNGEFNNDLISKPLILQNGEVENESKESRTTSENVADNNNKKEKEKEKEIAIKKTDKCSSSEDEESESPESEKREDEDDKYIEENLLDMPSIRNKRLSVSAEAYGEWNKKKTDFVPKVYEKDEKEKKKIREAINESFLFSHLNDKEIETIINAFFGKKVEKGCCIINEGDSGDLLYVIDEGEVEIYKTKIIEKEVNGIKETCNEKETLTMLKSKDVFGELALLYNSKRAATAEAMTDCSLWVLDRESFNYIIKDTVAKNRQMYEEILKQVNILKDVDPYERSKLADCLKSKEYKDGEIIIKEGEEGDTFYMLIDGNAVATKNDTIIKTYNKGDYFGELALLKNQPRAATVKCKNFCQVVYLDRKSFKRLLGPVEMILYRNVENYKKILKELGMDTTCIQAN